MDSKSDACSNPTILFPAKSPGEKELQSIFEYSSLGAISRRATLCLFQKQFNLPKNFFLICKHVFVRNCGVSIDVDLLSESPRRLKWNSTSILFITNDNMCIDSTLKLSTNVHSREFLQTGRCLVLE